MNKSLGWRLCCAAALIVALLTFTPLITPNGVWEPRWMGMPYTLWTGILQALVLVGLTWLGTRLHPSNKK
ncbi:MAG: hypothetical protein AAFR87_22020 [Bacteroidota bacterium]